MHHANSIAIIIVNHHGMVHAAKGITYINILLTTKIVLKTLR
jgi:hypothetical protein